MQTPQEEDMNAAQEKSSSESQSKPPAKLRLLYESKDRRMCLFQDANGHLVAAPSSILA